MKKEEFIRKYQDWYKQAPEQAKPLFDTEIVEIVLNGIWPLIESLQKEVRDRENQIKEQKCNIEYLNIKLRATENQSKRIKELEGVIKEQSDTLFAAGFHAAGLNSRIKELEEKAKRSKLSQSDAFFVKKTPKERIDAIIYLIEEDDQMDSKQLIDMLNNLKDVVENDTQRIADLENKADHLTSQIDKVASFILSAMPHEIGNESACDVAIRVVKKQDQRIKELEEKQQWISVKDRLPKRASFVIGFKDNSLVLGLYYNADMEFKYGKENQTKQVTHWMPLPEPPKPLTHE